MKDRLYIKDNVDGQEHCISGDKQFYLIDVTSQYEPKHQDNSFIGVLNRMRDLRGYVARFIEDSFEKKLISQKERDIFYFRHIDYKSLELTGRQFGVTRERIRQIEAKVIEKIKNHLLNL